MASLRLYWKLSEFSFLTGLIAEVLLIMFLLCNGLNIAENEG